MKDYIGVKKLNAKPMTREEAEEFLKRDVGGDRTGEGYLVQYDGGYCTWSPKDVFEEAYQESHPDGYNFEPVDLGEVYPEYQARVNIEFDELFTKSQALAKFVLSDRFDSLPDEEQNRMDKQLKAMIMYRDVLYDRITNF